MDIENTTSEINATLEPTVANNTLPWLYDIDPGDTNWIITSSFMIFTMQTGKYSNTPTYTCLTVSTFQDSVC